MKLLVLHSELGVLRGGGENLRGIVAMAAAAQAVAGRELVRAARVGRLRDRLQEGLGTSLELQINGPEPEARLPVFTRFLVDSIHRAIRSHP